MPINPIKRALSSRGLISAIIVVDIVTVCLNNPIGIRLNIILQFNLLKLNEIKEGDHTQYKESKLLEQEIERNS